MFDFEKRLTDIGRQTILCIGDLMLDDFVYGEVSRISPEAPAPVISGQPRGCHHRRRRQRRAQHRKPRRALPVRRRHRRRSGRQDAAIGAWTVARAAITSHLVVDPLAPDDAQAALCLRASFDASAARRLGACQAGRCQDRSRADQARARAAAAGRRGGALRLRQGRADAAPDPHRDRAREEAQQAGHRRSQGHRFLDLSRRHHHHAEPQGAGRCDAPAGRHRRRARRRRRRACARGRQQGRAGDAQRGGHDAARARRRRRCMCRPIR